MDKVRIDPSQIVILRADTLNVINEIRESVPNILEFWPDMFIIMFSNTPVLVGGFKQYRSSAQIALAPVTISGVTESVFTTNIAELVLHPFIHHFFRIKNKDEVILYQYKNSEDVASFYKEIFAFKHTEYTNNQYTMWKMTIKEFEKWDYLIQQDLRQDLSDLEHLVQASQVLCQTNDIPKQQTDQEQMTSV